MTVHLAEAWNYICLLLWQWCRSSFGPVSWLWHQCRWVPVLFLWPLSVLDSHLMSSVHSDLFLFFLFLGRNRLCWPQPLAKSAHREHSDRFGNMRSSLQIWSNRLKNNIRILHHLLHQKNAWTFLFLPCVLSYQQWRRTLQTPAACRNQLTVLGTFCIGGRSVFSIDNSAPSPRLPPHPKRRCPATIERSSNYLTMGRVKQRGILWATSLMYLRD